MKILDGKKRANSLEKNIKKETGVFIQKTGIKPGLGILLVGNDPASGLYVSLKKRKAQELGFFCESVVLSQETSQEKVIGALKELQAQNTIHGVIIQLPLPKNFSSDEILHQLNPDKDIDCLHPYNLTRLFCGKELAYAPPTAESVIQLIRLSEKSIRNSAITVIARGFFGRQIAGLCLRHGGIVTQVDVRAPSFAHAVKTADIVVSAVGRARCVTGSMIKKGAVVIDVGTCKEQGCISGDVDVKTVSKKASAITPVPGGVGPLTVVLLMQNVLKAAKLAMNTHKA
jgi:methylenetetrahydrofolate dehydrogenase (NADP+)/methenyltetrahydrofolate cyclohydrolase